MDIQDKKTCVRYRRPTKKDVYALDIYDVVYDPLMDPLDIESARYVIHQNIFRSLREVLADDRYTAKKYYDPEYRQGGYGGLLVEKLIKIVKILEPIK